VTGFDVHAGEVEQLLQRAASASGRTDESEHNLVSIHVACVGHVDGDVAHNMERALLQGNP
jgi:hypothetical protein